MNELPMYERNVLGAVIMRAIHDYAGEAQVALEHRRSARQFLFNDDPKFSNLRLFAELLFRDPDGFIRELRRRLKEGSIQLKDIVCFTC